MSTPYDGDPRSCTSSALPEELLADGVVGSEESWDEWRASYSRRNNDYCETSAMRCEVLGGDTLAGDALLVHILTLLKVFAFSYTCEEAVFLDLYVGAIGVCTFCICPWRRTPTERTVSSSNARQ